MDYLNSRSYKIVFCDIDGTLVDSKNQISKGTRQKIQEIFSNNIPFILVSARMPSGILPLQRELGIKAPIICYSGALILNEFGDCVKMVGIGRDRAAIIEGFIKKGWNHVCCTACSYDDWIVDNANEKWVVQEQNITSTMPTEGKIFDLVPEEGHVHKFLCMGDAENIFSLDKALKEEFPELSICRSKDTYLEIMEGGVSKSGAVNYICKDYGISTRDAVSFGDNYNDVDMLLATGNSFAMGNAPEEVKRQARNVTLDNDHEGVLVGLRQLNFT